MLSRLVQEVRTRPMARRGFSDVIKLTFVDADGDQEEVEAEVGETLLDIAHDNDIEVEGACGGEMACSTCHMILPQESTCVVWGCIPSIGSCFFSFFPVVFSNLVISPPMLMQYTPNSHLAPSLSKSVKSNLNKNNTTIVQSISPHKLTPHSFSVRFPPLPGRNRRGRRRHARSSPWINGNQSIRLPSQGLPRVGRREDHATCRNSDSIVCACV